MVVVFELLCRWEEMLSTRCCGDEDVLSKVVVTELIRKETFKLR